MPGLSGCPPAGRGPCSSKYLETLVRSQRVNQRHQASFRVALPLP
jgi:hypothetical protein